MANYNTSNTDSKHYQDTFSQLREYAYRTCIPYYIFWDSELTLNHHRLYCLIEQMESNPNPKVKPTFSYKWFADLIGIDVRSAKRIAQTLKRKKYIEHVRLSNNTWIWRTVKNMVIDDQPEDNDEMTPEVTEGVTREVTGGVTREVTQISKKIKYNKTTTTEQPHAQSSFKSEHCGKRADNNQTETKEPEQDANPIQDSITEAQDVVVFESPNQDQYVINKIKDAPKENRPEYSTVKFLKEIKYHIEKHYPDNFHHGVNAVAKLLRKHKWSTPSGYVDVDAENARKKENERRYQEMLKAQEEMSRKKLNELECALKRAKNEIIKRPVATKAFSSAIKSMYDVLGASRVLKNTQSGGSVFAQAS